MTGVPGSQRPPNHPKTIQKPLTRERAVEDDDEAEMVLAAYTPDRVRGKADCLRLIREVLDAGPVVEDLLQAVKAYATESAGFTRSKVCFSDNWFRSDRWLKYLHEVEEAREVGKAKEAQLLRGLANWVTESHPLCRHITPSQVTALLAAKLVTEVDIKAAGLAT